MCLASLGQPLLGLRAFSVRKLITVCRFLRRDHPTAGEVQTMAFHSCWMQIRMICWMRDLNVFVVPLLDGLTPKTNKPIKKYSHKVIASLTEILAVFTVPRLRAEEVAPRIVHHPSDVVVKPGNPARLSCRAEGSPQVSVEWLRNGQPLQMSKADGQMQPMVLSEGSLFFLSVGEGRRGPSHEGVYTCVARNPVGTAVSRNASLHIAGMRRSTQITALYHSSRP